MSIHQIDLAAWVTEREAIELRITVLEQAFRKTPPNKIAELHLFHVELEKAYKTLMQIVSKNNKTIKSIAS